MKTYMKLAVVLEISSISLLVFWLSPPVVAGDPPSIANATSLSPLSLASVGTSDYKYVGSKKCKKCHIKQYKSWAETRMAKAFDILKPGEHAEAKKKFHINVNQDYTKDTLCIKCHTVGFGSTGGYFTPNPDDKKQVRKAKKLEGVGCESCHGPGGEYVKVFEEIMKSKREYNVEELYAVGLTKIDANTCKTCHNEESPTINADEPFDFEKRKEEGSHKHHPLKQRAE